MILKKINKRFEDKFMKDKDSQFKNIQRNPFVALCDYASRNNWCWKIFCTTCGHGSFRVAFSKLIHNQCPDDKSFWPYGAENHSLLKELESFNDFWRDSTKENQIKLVSIVAEAKLSDIKDVAKFPDWLGYIGLVISHCPNREAQKIISDSFLSQFITMLSGNEEIVNYLQEKKSKNELLSINDLSRIEKIKGR